MKTKTIYKNKNPILQIQHSMVDPKTENRWWEMGKLWLHQSYKQVPISHFSNKVNLDFFIFFFCHKLWACLTDGEMVAGASTMEILHCIRVASKEKGQRVNSSSCNMFSTDEPHPCDQQGSNSWWLEVARRKKEGSLYGCISKKKTVSNISKEWCERACILCALLQRAPPLMNGRFSVPPGRTGSLFPHSSPSYSERYFM